MIKTFYDLRTFYLLVIALVVLTAAFWYLQSIKNEAFLSVEFGLAELSPQGEEGGWAMPASGASNPGSPRATCSTYGDQVTLQWNAAQSTQGYDEKVFASRSDTSFLLGVKVAHADSGSSAPAPHSHPVTYNVSLSGVGSRNNLSTTQTTFNVNPGQTYTWQVQACAGGSCSAWQSSSFTCPLPPPPVATISQNINPVVIDTNHSVNYGPANSSAPATSCQLQAREPGGSFTTVHSNSGGSSSRNYTYNSSQVGTWQYRAQCANAGGISPWVTLDTVVVYPPPVVDLTAAPTTIKYLESTSLSWTTSNVQAGTCTASSDPTGFWSGNKANSGSGEMVTELESATGFTLRCTGLNGSPAQDTAQVSMEYGTGGTIVPCAGDEVVYRDEPMCVEYSVGTSDPAHCDIRTGNTVIASSLAQSGMVDWSIRGETIFTLYCEGGGHVRETTVRVLPEFQES